MIHGDGNPSTYFSEGGLRVTQHGWTRFKQLMRSKRLYCAVILIFMAAIVKGSVEEVLPFHADHRWRLEPLQIGNLFSFIAFAYICSSLLSGHLWSALEATDKWKVTLNKRGKPSLGIRVELDGKNL